MNGALFDIGQRQGNLPDHFKVYHLICHSVMVVVSALFQPGNNRPVLWITHGKDFAPRLAKDGNGMPAPLAESFGLCAGVGRFGAESESGIGFSSFRSIKGNPDGEVG